MKKSMIFVGMLAIGYANAQEGVVGINTENPKATLQVTPSEENAKATATTNEGIMAPQLSKSRVAGIATPVEGTLVYVTDETTSPISAYTGTDAKVAKITEKGYYFYNGTEWVKAGANGELWAQRNNNGVTETYLKPAETDGNKVYYSPKGVTNLFGAITEDVTWETNNAIAYKFDEIPNFTGISSSKFKQSNIMANGGSYLFSKDSYQLFGADAVNGTGKSYVGKTLSTVVQNDVANNIHSVAGLNTSVSHKGSSKVNYLTGLDIYTFMGTTHDNNSNPEAISNIAAGFNPRILKGKVDNMTGIWIYPRVYGGEVKNIVASNILLNTSELLNGVTTTLPTMSYREVVGYKVDINNRTNTTAKHLAGADFFTSYDNGSTAEYGYSLIARGNVAEGAKVDNYHGVVSYLNATGAANVENVYGFKHSANFVDTFKPNNEFGLWIDNVDNGLNSNYSIYTNAGKIRVGDLADTSATADRVVTVDANGVLKTGGSIASNNGVQNETGMTCTAANAGKINYTTIQKDGKDVGVFGFCMQKGTDYVWAYMLGGSNIYGTSANGAAFGQGL